MGGTARVRVRDHHHGARLHRHRAAHATLPPQSPPLSPKAPAALFRLKRSFLLPLESTKCVLSVCLPAPSVLDPGFARGAPILHVRTFVLKGAQGGMSLCVESGLVFCGLGTVPRRFETMSI